MEFLAVKTRGYLNIKDRSNSIPMCSGDEIMRSVVKIYTVFTLKFQSIFNEKNKIY